MKLWLSHPLFSGKGTELFISILKKEKKKGHNFIFLTSISLKFSLASCILTYILE